MPSVKHDKICDFGIDPKNVRKIWPNWQALGAGPSWMLQQMIINKRFI
jgi:hypothetical protein